MSKANLFDHASQTKEFPGLSFRHIKGESDYPQMLSIVSASDRADQVSGTPSLDGIKHWCAPSNRFNPTGDILFALIKNYKYPVKVWGLIPASGWVRQGRVPALRSPATRPKRGFLWCQCAHSGYSGVVWLG